VDSSKAKADYTDTLSESCRMHMHKKHLHGWWPLGISSANSLKRNRSYSVFALLWRHN
jgi:hypothetical protein